MVSANGQNRRWFNDSHAAVATYTRHPRVTAEYHEACMSAIRGQPRRRQPHCKPTGRPSTGRANARPMTGSAPPRGAVIASAAKQSILSLRGEMDCFAALAMTISGHAV